MYTTPLGVRKDGSMFNIGAIFELVIGGIFDESIPFSNVFQFQLTAGSTPFTFAQVIDEMGEVAQGLADLFVTQQSELVVWQYYTVATLQGNNVSGSQPLPDGDTPGVLTDDPLPSQTTFQLRFPTHESRRILRKAMIGGVETQTGGSGNWDTATRNAWLVIAAAMVVEQESTNASWLYCYNDFKTNPPGTTVVPTSLGVSGIPKVQRRRRPAG